MQEPKTPTDIPEPEELPAVLPRRRWSFDRERVVVWVLVLSGILMRLWYLYDFAGSPLFDLAIGADVGEYHQRARQLLLGVHFPASPDIHAPLYSYFLALLLKLGGGSVPFVRVVQLVLNYGAWLLFYWLLKTRRTPLGVRLWFLAIVMLLPVPVFYQAELVSESLLLPLTAAFFWLRHLADAAASRERRATALCGAGAVLAAMNLTHPMTLLFSAAEVGWELFRRRFRRAALLAAIPILLAGGFCAVQSVHYRQFCGIQANAGFNLYLGNNPDAGGGCYLRPGRRWRNVHRDAEREAAARGVSADRVFLERAGKFWLRHPLKGVRLWGLKALKVCSPRELSSGCDMPPLLCFTRVVFLGRLVTPLVLLAAGFGLWRIFRRRRILYVHCLLLFFSLYLAQIVTVTSGRYRLLMLVPAALFAAHGILEFDWKRFWYVVPPVFIVCGFFTVTDYGKMRAEAAALYAEAALKNDDPRQCDALAAYALRGIDNPDPAHCWELRGAAAKRLAAVAKAEGAAAARRGDEGAAARHLREAQQRIDFAGSCCLKMVEVEPEFYRGWMHLALLAEAGGRSERSEEWYAKADEWYRKALALAPRAPELCYNYALFCFDTGRPCAEAIRNAVAAAPSWFLPWRLAGRHARREGELRRALECFYRAVELSPDADTRATNLKSLREIERELENSK